MFRTKTYSKAKKIPVATAQYTVEPIITRFIVLYNSGFFEYSCIDRSHLVMRRFLIRKKATISSANRFPLNVSRSSDDLELIPSETEVIKKPKTYRNAINIQFISLLAYLSKSFSNLSSSGISVNSDLLTNLRVFLLTGKVKAANATATAI
jgi:hypothetical protein